MAIKHYTLTEVLLLPKMHVEESLPITEINATSLIFASK